jgi:hypothetical protein
MSVPIAAGITPAWQGCSGPPPPNAPAAWGYAARSPDGGENLEDHPRPREQIRPSQGSVSACELPDKFVPGALNLFHSVQTKPCLGHCITRGIGLRRQATILRLRGAVLFSGGGPAGEFGRASGVTTQQHEDLCREDLCRACARQNVFVTRWNMELCGSAPVIAEECGRFP